MDGWMDGWMGGWMDGWVGGWVGGVGGWMDGWMDGWGRQASAACESRGTPSAPYHDTNMDRRLLQSLRSMLVS